MVRQRLSWMLIVVLASGVAYFVGECRRTATPPTSDDELTGAYRMSNGHVIGITRFLLDDGESVLLYADYASSVVRRLFRRGEDRFTIGPSFGISEPIELSIRAVKSGSHAVSAIAVERTGQRELLAPRLPVSSREVTFTGSEGAVLAGTLFTPSTPGPHPAIVLLHGSGQLTRFSFGPYPTFFTSLGLTVLVYDKRGSGESTGIFLPRATYYPEVFLDDAISAVRFLQHEATIDPTQIGLWGSSEGGMLTTQVAARVRDIAFIINSSGFIMPLWQQVLYNIEAQLRADGFSPDDVEEAVSFERRALQVMRTGQQWADYADAQERARHKPWWTAYFGSAAGFSSPEAIRWQWDHVYSFDPLPRLRSVSCPVLGLFGTLDTSTPARVAAANMQRVLGESGNRDVTIKVFEGANHSLMEARTGGHSEIPSLKGIAPGVFETLRSWLSTHISPTPS